jgi:hypothetical protein
MRATLAAQAHLVRLRQSRQSVVNAARNKEQLAAGLHGSGVPGVEVQGAVST